MEVKESVVNFLLGCLRKKPGMFLGMNHISLLSTFMSGYMISLMNNGFDISTDQFFGAENSGFFDWYSKKHKIEFSSNWYSTMLLQSNNSEEKALDLFFSSLEEFCKYRNIKIHDIDSEKYR